MTRLLSGILWVILYCQTTITTVTPGNIGIAQRDGNFGSWLRVLRFQIVDRWRLQKPLSESQDVGVAG